MSPAVDICLRFLSFDLVELSLLHHGVAKDISCVGGNQGKFVFMLRQNGDWRKISSFLLSDNFNYGLLTDAGNCTQSSFPTLFNISMIELFSNNLKRWCVPSLPFPTVHGPFVVHIPHQKMQKKKKRIPPTKIQQKRQQLSEVDSANANHVTHRHMHGIRHAGRHQKSSVNSWINVLGNNRISTVDAVIRITPTKAGNYIVKAD